mgnify:CR=1 FL=1
MVNGNIKRTAANVNGLKLERISGIQYCFATYKGEIKGLDFVISRKGSGPKDTKYKVIPVPTEFKAEMVPMKVEDVPF